MNSLAEYFMKGRESVLHKKKDTPTEIDETEAKKQRAEALASIETSISLILRDLLRNSEIGEDVMNIFKQSAVPGANHASVSLLEGRMLEGDGVDFDIRIGMDFDTSLPAKCQKGKICLEGFAHEHANRDNRPELLSTMIEVDPEIFDFLKNLAKVEALAELLGRKYGQMIQA